ncbi:MAG: YjfB family protein [Lachnospiraceae bacterium]|nr:YjfB family protein [Lachnospiraceae bacterium]
MDIAGLSMSMARQNSLSEVGTAVLAKTLDTVEANGAGIVKMIDAAAMERSVNPSVGSNFDMVI